MQSYCWIGERHHVDVKSSLAAVISAKTLAFDFHYLQLLHKKNDSLKLDFTSGVTNILFKKNKFLTDSN